jgi:alkylation response protein AidB-like acyl-CoA dehydrogenase
MATATLTKPAAKGGSFLLESPQPGDVFTPADLSDDQRLIGQTAEEFVLKEVFPFIKDLENKKAGLMASLVKKGGEVGLMGGGVPEEYGGAGLDKISKASRSTRRLRGDARRARGDWALPIVYFGTEGKEIPTELATGEWIGACLSNRKRIGRAEFADARATPGNSPHLNGQKMWITTADLPTCTLYLRRWTAKFTAFIVERSFPAKPGNEEHKMGIHGSSTTPIFLENCKVPKENLLHEIGRGHIVAFNILNAGRFTLGASCVGGSKHVLMTSSKYCKERKAFHKQIGEFGMMKEKLAEMAIQIFAVESMVYRSAGNISGDHGGFLPDRAIDPEFDERS